MKTNPLHLGAICLTMASLAQSFSSAAGATIVPLTQKRCVSASAVFGAPTNTAACASNFGAFDGAVHLGWLNQFEPWSLDSSQQSQISATSISATGTVALAFAHPLVSGRVTNEFRVGFRLTQPVNFTLAGSLQWDGAFGPVGSQSPVVRLSGAQGVIFETAAALNDGTPLDFANNGSLPAGQYLIEAYAGSGSDFGGGETIGLSLDFQVSPTGPAVAGDPVYQLTGVLVGLDQQGKAIATRIFTPQSLVNLALGNPIGSSAGDRTLGLVMDCAANAPSQVVVWDKRASNVVAVVGTLQLTTALGSKASYTAVGNLALSNSGAIIDTVDPVNSQLAILVNALKTPATTSCLNAVTLTSSLGQMFLREGGGTNTVLIRTGALTSGRKLGHLP